MRIGVIGINNKSSDLVLRECLTRVSQKHLCYDFSRKIACRYVLLSTCNRVEIYFSAEDLAQAHSDLLGILRQDMSLVFEHTMYSYFGFECFSHLAKVTSGFDSVIFGEAEIQRQVKEAYEQACLYQTLPPTLHYLFQKCLKIGKEVRTAFSLPKRSVSMESVLWELIDCFFVERSSVSILFIGNSEINRKILPYFQEKGAARLSLATRAPASAQELVNDMQIDMLSWEKLHNWVDFDVVISGTHAPGYLICPRQIDFREIGFKNRLAIDLGMPRNIDPALGKHPQVTLLNIEELGQLIDQKQKMSLELHEEVKNKLEQAAFRQIQLFEDKKTRVSPCTF